MTVRLMLLSTRRHDPFCCVRVYACVGARTRLYTCVDQTGLFFVNFTSFNVFFYISVHFGPDKSIAN